MDRAARVERRPLARSTSQRARPHRRERRIDRRLDEAAGVASLATYPLFRLKFESFSCTPCSPSFASGYLLVADFQLLLQHVQSLQDQVQANSHQLAKYAAALAEAQALPDTLVAATCALPATAFSTGPPFAHAAGSAQPAGATASTAEGISHLNACFLPLEQVQLSDVRVHVWAKPNAFTASAPSNNQPEWGQKSAGFLGSGPSDSTGIFQKAPLSAYAAGEGQYPTFGQATHSSLGPQPAPEDGSPPHNIAETTAVLDDLAMSRDIGRSALHNTEGATLSALLGLSESAEILILITLDSNPD